MVTFVVFLQHDDYILHKLITRPLKKLFPSNASPNTLRELKNHTIIYFSPSRLSSSSIISSDIIPAGMNGR